MDPHVLVLAPGGRDAQVAAAVLREVGITCTNCANLAELVERLSEGASAAILVENALASNCAPLFDWIERQPPWSDFPFIILTRTGTTRSSAVLTLLKRLGNPMLLERPFRAETFASAVQSAVRARQRQLEHARAEELLRQAQKVEAIGRLTGGIAHDFNNLLTVVLGNLELLLPFAPSERARRQIESAQRAASRGAQLCANLLAFARRQPMQVTTIVANTLISDLATLIEKVLGEGISLNLSLDDDLLPCRADAAQLQAAVLNLVTNARDAMPGGGTLTLTTCNVALTAADLIGNSDARPGKFVAIAVGDTGSGMSPDALAHAFDPFYTTKEVGHGTGLGLSQVYGFIRQCSGHVSIQTTRGRTTVTLFLPACDPAAVSPDEGLENRAAAEGGNGAAILLVEDDESVLELTTATLSEAGYRVQTACDGQQALARLRSDDGIELIFSDIVMPHGMSGVELGRKARMLRPGIKVLLTSGYPGTILHREATAGEFDVLAKPFCPAQLVARIRSILNPDAARVPMQKKGSPQTAAIGENDRL